LNIDLKTEYSIHMHVNKEIQKKIFKIKKIEEKPYWTSTGL